MSKVEIVALENIIKLVVIAGCQRSGTTLTGQIIGAHPNAFLLDEHDGIYNWFHSTDDKLCAEGDQFEHLIQLANKKYRDIHSRLNIKPNGDAVLKQKISHLVLKAPNLTYNFSRLARLNIDVSVIYPQRDPRSVVASMSKLIAIEAIDMVGNQCRILRKNKELASEYSSELSKIEQNKVPDHIKCALIWRIKTKMNQKFIEAGIPTFIFDYESLVSNKKDYCLKFANHIGLQPSLQMEQHETVYKGDGPGGTKRSRSVDRTSINLWTQTLTNNQANDILRETGYKVRSTN